MVPRPSDAPAWRVLIGPGERLECLEAVLAALSTRADVRGIGDLLELLGGDPSDRAAQGCVVLDAQALPLEDVGLVRRFLAREPGFGVVLVGEDPRGSSVRALAGEERVRWIFWPPTLEELAALVRDDPAPAPRAGSREPRAVVRAEPAAPEPAPEPDTEPETEPPEAALGTPEDLAEIEAILSGDADLRAAPAPGEDRGGASAERLPDYYRAQIADLADIAQRLELAVRSLHESAELWPGAMKQVADVDADVFRLVQFTRTLGYLAAPPATGVQEIDVRPLVEEMLAGFASGDAGEPRFLFRGDSELLVRSDKALLVQALDALFALARTCASGAPGGPGAAGEGVVRTSARRAGGDGAAADVLVEVRFPAGPLAGVAPEEIVRPYALRRVLPHIGANALAAARSILRGQGGDLTLSAPDPGQLVWRVRLPAAGAPARRGNGFG